MRSNRANSPPLPLLLTGAPILVTVNFAEDLSHSDSGTQSFMSSKSSSLTRSQADSSDVPNKRREHLLVVSSFLFALIWGFGGHLPSRYLQGWGVADAEG